MRLRSKALWLGGIVIIGAGLVIGSTACDGGAATDPPTSTAAMSAAKSGPDETASTVDSARVNPTAAVEPTTVSATVQAAPAPTAARAVPVSTTVPEVAKPTPSPTEEAYVYEPQGKYIESPDRKILIDVVDPIDDAMLENYLKNVTYVYESLEKLYGSAPEEQYVLFVQGGRAHMKPLQLVGVLFPLDDGDIDTVAAQDGAKRLMANETSHWFTYHLFRTNQLWFNEGLSNYADMYIRKGVDDPGFRYTDHIHAAFSKRSYEIIKGGSLFSADPDFIEYATGAHGTGDIFFMLMEIDAGFTINDFTALLKRLTLLSDSGRPTIGLGEIRQATTKVSGQDISDLFRLLEPGIEFNNHGNLELFKSRYPHYFKQGSQSTD